MPTATLTAKGQTTIPKSVRDRYRLKPGDRVELIVQDDGAALMVPAISALADLEGMVRATGKRVTIEDMNRAIEKRGGRL
ncbi:MAG: AbrB/MazE/SpoVT family DNA-binding domain-containing protein [Pseudomonadota bacterium]